MTTIDRNTHTPSDISGHKLTFTRLGDFENLDLTVDFADHTIQVEMVEFEEGDNGDWKAEIINMDEDGEDIMEDLVGAKFLIGTETYTAVELFAYIEACDTILKSRVLQTGTAFIGLATALEAIS